MEQHRRVLRSVGVAVAGGRLVRLDHVHVRLDGRRHWLGFGPRGALQRLARHRRLGERLSAERFRAERLRARRLLQRSHCWRCGGGGGGGCRCRARPGSRTRCRLASRLGRSLGRRAPRRSLVASRRPLRGRLLALRTYLTSYIVRAWVRIAATHYLA